MPSKADGRRHEESQYDLGRKGTYRRCPVELALSRYEGELIVKVQDKLPTGAR